MPITLENVGIAVRDLDATIAFFTDLGLTLLGRDEVSGEWADTAVGLDGDHARIAVLQTPDGHGRIELSQYLHPDAVETEPTLPHEIGMHRVAFSVDDLGDALAVAAQHGCHPLRGVADYQGVYRLTYLRGPSGIIVMLAQDLRKGVLAELATRTSTVVLRHAVAADVTAVVALLGDDQLGRERDAIDDVDDVEELQPYLRAFEAIDADPAHLLLVAEAGGAVVATMQLSFLPGLARRGSLRAQVEGVRVDADHRSGGLGTALVTWAVGESRRRGCSLVQLTSDKRRTDAHRFYERFGFTASHEGMKLHL